jgi:hypothetical protein
MASLDMKSVESIEVNKDSTTVKLYGEAAKNSVVIITTKKAAKTKLKNSGN